MLMEKKQYISPAIRVLDVDYDSAFCLSGNHEGFTEEDWGEP